MKAAVLMGVGAAFFVFGILWLFASSSLVYAFFPPTGRNTTLLSQVDLVRQMAGVLVAAAGAGLLTYGHATKADKSQQAGTA